MFNEKEILSVNKFLSNQTFTCSSPLLSHDSPKYEFEYSFKVIGEKKMISVGEYYMFAMVDVEILEIEEKYKLYFKIMGRDYDKDRILRIFFIKEYLFQHSLNSCLSEILQYTINGEDRPRVNITDITMSDELYDNIMNTEIRGTV